MFLGFCNYDMIYGSFKNVKMVIWDLGKFEISKWTLRYKQTRAIDYSFDSSGGDVKHQEIKRMCEVL